MPKVPYSGLTEVNPNPISQNRQSSAGANAMAFGAGQAAGMEAVGEGISRVGIVAGNIAKDMQERDDARELLDAETAWQSYVRDTLVGTADKPGFYSNKGINAVNAARGTVDGMNKTRAEMSKNIKNHRVREKFDASTGQDLNHHLGKVASHSMQERTIAESASRKAGIAEAKQHAAAFATDAGEVNMALDVVEALTREEAASAGYDEKTTAALVEAERSQVYKEAIVSMSTQDAAGALAYYKSVKGDIDGDVQGEIEKVLEGENMLEQAQSLAEEAIALYPGDYASQRDHVREKSSGKLEDSGIKEINQRAGEEYTDLNREQILENRAIARLDREERMARVSETAEVKAAWGEAAAHANSGGSVDEWLRANPEKAALVMTKTEFKNLYVLESAALEGLSYAKASDGETFARFQRMSPEELSKLSQEEINAHQRLLTQREFRDVLQMRKTAETSMNHLHGPLFSAGDKALTKFGPKWMNSPAKMNATQQAARAAMTQGMHEWLSDQVNAGKVPDQTAIDTKARELGREVVLPGKPGLIWDGPSKTMPAISAAKDLTPEQKDKLRIPVDKMTDAQKASIKNLITRAKLPYSDDLAERVAAAYAMNDMERVRTLLKPTSKD
jgi:hypothetical protein